MPIKLTPRLSLCAESVSKNAILLDIGTDHAHLPCFLAETGWVCHAYACDVADGPVSAALHTVKVLNLEDKVGVLKSDGFKDIPVDVLGAATDVVIAGMGGELICEILSLHHLLRTSVRLILQPNTRAPILRRFLADNGFNIVSERAAEEGKFVYTVMIAERVHDGLRRVVTDFEAETGKLDPNDPAAKKYLKNNANRLRQAAEGMARSTDPDDKKEAERQIGLADEIEKYISKNGK